MNAFLKMVLLFGICSQAWALEVALEKIQVATDVHAIELGAEGMMNFCHGCHSMKYIKYRDLLNFGMDKQKVETWRGDQPIDSPLMAQMSETDATQAFGKAPPDLSLMAKARDGGVNYLYSYLIGYYTTAEGMPGNHVYPETKMPDPLGIAGITDAAQIKEIDGRARDIVSFVAWVSDPHEAERTRLGYYVIAYLIVLTTLLYFVKKQIWSKLE
jgi:cytochrome c1